VSSEASEPSGQTNAVALFLAATAVIAVLIGWRASVDSSAASGSWQSSVRTQVRHDAALATDVQTVISNEAPGAWSYIAAQLRATAYGAAERNHRGDAREALTVEKLIQQTFAEGLAAETALVAGGYMDEGKLGLAPYLADLRDENPDLVGLDASAVAAEGEGSYEDAMRMMFLTVPAAVAFGLGALAQGFERRRRLLLILGTVVLAATAVLALIAEVS
jgi:hypothetical protein